MKIQSMASISVIVEDEAPSTKLYRDILGIQFEGGEGAYVFTEKLDGVKHFGLWPIKEAAEACLGKPSWSEHLPRPQASVEFEVGSVAEVRSAAEELREAGYALLHDAKEEPWGQTIARLIGETGLIVGICYTPWFHD